MCELIRLAQRPDGYINTYYTLRKADNCDKSFRRATICAVARTCRKITARRATASSGRITASITCNRGTSCTALVASFRGGGCLRPRHRQAGYLEHGLPIRGLPDRGVRRRGRATESLPRASGGRGRVGETLRGDRRAALLTLRISSSASADRSPCILKWNGNKRAFTICSAGRCCT